MRKALLDRKTLGYCGGNIIGEISLLKKFFEASISVKFVKDAKNGNMSIMLTNHTSFDFDLKYKGRLIRVPALGSTITSMKKQSTLVLTVDNMYHIDYLHPTFEVKVLGM